MTDQITLLGQKISLKTAGNPEHVREVIGLVNARIAVAEKRIKTSAPHHVAVLALLDLAEEYVQAKKRMAEHQIELDEKSREMIELIEVESK
jgi:cell division protein ZapA (FtsZ GTPase activity inhibitor)